MSYTVKPGDSWAKIAGKLYGGDQRMFGELMRANKGVLTLKAGMKISTPKKVDNPFVSFAQAEWAAGTNKDPNMVNKTTELISGMKGGSDWLASLPGATKQTQTGGRGSILPTAADYAQLRAAYGAGGGRGSILPTASDFKTPTLTTQQAAMRGRGATSATVSPAPEAGVSPYAKPSSFASTPKGTTRYSPGQKTPSVESLLAANPIRQGFLAASNFISGVKTPEIGTNVRNMAPGIAPNLTAGPNFAIPQLQVQTNLRNQAPGVKNVSPGAQPLNQPTGTQTPNATGANNLAYSKTDSWEQGVIEAQQIAQELLGDVLPRKVYSNNGIVRAIAMSGIPAEQAQELATKTMVAFGWKRQGGMWLPPTPGVDDTLPDPLADSGTSANLDWKNMDLSTLTQMGFYDAPTQPTFSNTGRNEGGGAQPAPAGYSVVSGTSWRINP
jgi:hypothetical protein